MKLKEKFNISKSEFNSILISCDTKKDILARLDVRDSGASRQHLKNKIEELGLSFTAKLTPASKKYERKLKACPVCTSLFLVAAGSPREQTTCSYSCANTFFRSGVNSPNWKHGSYRATCFEYHEKKCIVCDEEKIVAVHHLDGDHSNNEVTNLMPLCPTHHQYWHSRYRSEVQEQILEYARKFKENYATIV